MRNLEIRWSISRGRETFGWTICTLWEGKKRYSTNGGGYDMTGTVFAEWLWANYKDEIIAKVKPDGEEGGLYGFFHRYDRYYIDGACGLDCMERIAKAIGLNVQKVYNKSRLTNFLIN